MHALNLHLRLPDVCWPTFRFTPRLAENRPLLGGIKNLKVVNAIVFERSP